MKSIPTIMFLSFFVVFAAITNSVHCTLDPPDSPEQVRDTNGKLVRVNNNYYIIPMTEGTGGGLVLRNTSHKSCPVGIFQDEENDDNSGIPVSFYPVNSKKGVIRVSTDLNIEFSDIPVQCGKSNFWKVDNYNRHPKRFYIAPDGIKGNPGSETLGNWFKIEKFESRYKLVHCPSVVDDDYDVLCKDVGLLKYSGQMRLALTDTPFGVVFKKA